MGNLLNIAMKAIEPNHIAPHSDYRKEIKIINDVKPQERQDSLSDRMDTIILSSRDRMIKAYNGQQFISNAKIARVESEITAIRNDVLSGKANLQDYSNHVIEWERLCINAKEENP